MKVDELKKDIEEMEENIPTSDKFSWKIKNPFYGEKKPESMQFKDETKYED